MIDSDQIAKRPVLMRIARIFMAVVGAAGFLSACLGILAPPQSALGFRLGVSIAPGTIMLPGDDEVAGSPGLFVTFRSRAKQAPSGTDVRPSRLASLYVPRDEPPTPFFPPGPFEA